MRPKAVTSPLLNAWLPGIREERKVMNAIILSDLIKLNQVHRCTDSMTDFYKGVMQIGNKCINISYDCNNRVMIMNDVYRIDLSIMNRAILLVDNYFQNLLNEELFSAAVTAMDRYLAEVEMDFPGAEIERRDREMTEKLDKIDRMGLSEEFAEYSCIL